MSAELQSIASQEDFLRAVTWQNHRLVDGTIRSFLQWDPATDNRHFRHRQREELIASYWQRYCVKNDTIGFFGPSGWGKLGGRGRTRFAPGEGMLRSSEVFFEAWAIDRLAEAIEEIPGMREWLMPRRLSFIKLDGNALVEPVGRRVMLSPEYVGRRACVTERREFKRHRNPREPSTCPRGGPGDPAGAAKSACLTRWKLEPPVCPGLSGTYAAFLMAWTTRRRVTRH